MVAVPRDRHGRLGGGLAALALVALVAILMVGLPRIRRSLPASIIAIVVRDARRDVARPRRDDRSGRCRAALPTPRLPVLDTASTSALFSAALAVAALAAIESLLSARVADGMTGTSPPQPRP